MQKAATSLYNATKNYVGMQNLPNQQATQQIPSTTKKTAPNN